MKILLKVVCVWLLIFLVAPALSVLLGYRNPVVPGYFFMVFLPCSLILWPLGLVWQHKEDKA